MHRHFILQQLEPSPKGPVSTQMHLWRLWRLQIKILMFKRNAFHFSPHKSNLLTSYLTDSFHLKEEILIMDDCFMNMKITYLLHNQTFNWHIISLPMECVEQIWNHVTDFSPASSWKWEACYFAKGIRKYLIQIFYYWLSTCFTQAKDCYRIHCWRRHAYYIKAQNLRGSCTDHYSVH